jgi:protein TonB
MRLAITTVLLVTPWFASLNARGQTVAVPHAGSGGIGIPNCQYCPKPTYTEQAREAKYEGTVLLQATVTLEGRATNITVVKGPGRFGVEKSAIEALRTWRFKPSVDANGKPVAAITTVDVDFHLP